MSKPQKSQKPTISLSKVPSIKEICESLGFQSASIKDTDRFLDTTRAFRKSYQGPAGMTNVDLLRWNDPLIQSEYRNMAEVFLSDVENSDGYWGSKRYWYSAGLQYPDDSDRIIALLMQLFFKQTKYAFNNLQYGHKHSEARDGSRDNTTPSSETFPQRPTPSRSTVPGDSQDSRISGRETPDPDVIHNETMPTANPSQGSGNGSRPPRDGDIYDGPDDFDEGLRNTLDILSAEDQPHTPTHLGPTSSGTNPRKRKKQSIVEPRRSGRKPVPTYTPGVISNPEEYDALFESSGSNEPVSETTEMDCSFDRDSSVEITNVSDRNIDPDGTGSSPPSARKPFKAPTAPMISVPTKPKTPVSKAKTSRLTSSSKAPEKAKSTTSDAASKKAPTSRSNILKLSVPSIKAQAKPLGKKVEARKHSSDGRHPADQTSTPPHKETEGFSSGVGAGSKKQSSTARLSLGQLQAQWDELSSATVPGTSRTDSPRISGTSDETLELETDATERGGNLPNQREAQPYALIADDVSFLRTQLKDSNSKTTAPATTSVPLSEPVDVPPQPPVAVQSIPPPQVPRPPTATQGQALLPKPTVTPTPRPKPQVPLWVITHTPRYTEELWDTGKLSGLTLPSFLTSLSSLTSRPADSINKIKFTLRTPISDTKITVGREAEDSWARVMDTFKKKLREVKGAFDMCSILVEPVWEEVVGVDGEEGGEVECDF